MRCLIDDGNSHSRKAKQKQNTHAYDDEFQNTHLAVVEDSALDGGIRAVVLCHGARSGAEFIMGVEDIDLQDLSVTEDEAGERIDRYLAVKLDGFSRSRLKALIKEGELRLNGAEMIEPNYRIKAGDAISLNLPPPVDPVPKPENIPLDVVFEDEHLIVINKPPGLVVHPAAGNWSGTLVNALIAHCGESLSGIGGVRRPGIVHRLDKDTSGLMVVAKTDKAHRSLSEQFAAHGRDGRMERAYLAVVWGKPPQPKGVISANLGRAQGNRTKMAVVPRGGREAVTRYEVLRSFSGSDGSTIVASLVRCVLETGRTHQIRVHMAHIGCPVLGDTTYGAGFKASARRLGEDAQAALSRLKRQALHAELLGFDHPETGRHENFSKKPPDDINELIQCLR